MLDLFAVFSSGRLLAANVYATVTHVRNRLDLLTPGHPESCMPGFHTRYTGMPGLNSYSMPGSATCDTGHKARLMPGVNVPHPPRQPRLGPGHNTEQRERFGGFARLSKLRRAPRRVLGGLPCEFFGDRRATPWHLAAAVSAGKRPRSEGE